MSKKTNPLNILYIEDEKQDYERLQMDANPYRILLTHETNLEDGIKTFKEKGEKYFDGIILDALCLIKKDDSTPKKGHMFKAWEEFHTLAPNLLKVVFTGETAVAQELNEWLEETEVNIFNKGNGDDVHRMLKMFIEKNKNKEDRIIASRFADVFEIVEEYMGSDAKEELINCIRTMDRSDSTIIKNNLACLRRLQEKIYLAINKSAPEVVLTEYIEKGFKVRDILRYLVDTEHVKKFTLIDSFGWMTYTIASDNGAHTPYENPEYPPTKYTVQAVTYALMDLVLWMKDIIKKNRH